MEALDEGWVQECLGALEALGLEWSRDQATDRASGDGAALSFSDGDTTWRFRVALERHLRPGTARHRIRTALADDVSDLRSTPWLVLTETITPTIAEILDELGVGYVDTAGNARLSQPGLHVSIAGRRARRPATTRRKTATPTALKLAFVLLKDGQACALPYRDLAERSDIALGSVGWVMDALDSEGFISRKWRHRTLRAPSRLHDHWEQHWTERLRPKLGAVVCKARPGADVRDLLEGCAQIDGCLVGGELAAAELVGEVRPTTATLHVPPGTVRETTRALGLLRSDDGNVRVMETFGREDAWSDGPGQGGFADPLLIRAEILGSSDDRLHGLANELRTRFIEPRWAGSTS